MTIYFACTCGRPFSVRNKRAGKIAVCPDCDRQIIVPQSSRISKQEVSDGLVNRRRNPDDTAHASIGVQSGGADAGVDSGLDFREDDDDIVGGLSPEQWAASGFPAARRVHAESSGASEQHDSWVVARKAEAAAEPERSRWWMVRLALLIVLLLGLIIANPYSLGNLGRLANGGAAEDVAIAHNDRGVEFDDQNKLPEAIAEFEEAIRLAPTLFEAHYNLGNSLDAAKRHPESLDAFRDAVTLKPNHAGANFGLGAALLNTGQLPEAERQLRNTILLYAGHAEAHLYLSYTLYKLKRFPEALNELRVAHELGAHFSAEYAQRVEAAVAASAS